jgi:hypothetical protein
MQSSLPELLREWHDFYTLVGTASATLVGLMFVAASIGAHVFNEQHRAAMGAFISPTVVHFSAALFICILAMIPAQTFVSLDVLLALGGVAGCVYSGRIAMQLFVGRRFTVDLVDRLFYALLPVAGYLLVLAAGGLLFVRPTTALMALAVGQIVLVLAGIRNAWDMTVWIVIRSPSSIPAGAAIAASTGDSEPQAPAAPQAQDALPSGDGRPGAVPRRPPNPPPSRPNPTDPGDAADLGSPQG